MDIMDLVVSKFGGTSLASSENFLKVKDIIQSQTNRRYIVASAPGKVKKEDTKITDLLYLCYDLANHKIAYMDILEKIYDKYNEIVKGAKVDIDLKKYIDELDYALKSEKSKDFIASRGEYINAIILSKLL